MIEKDRFGCRPYPDKIGILIAQLGTPAAPTKKALRIYLKQFLSDPRVIEVNRVLWWGLLNGIILNTRPKRSAALYRRIWTDVGSPLLKISQSQVVGLAKKIEQAGLSEISVVLGMRYGSPSIESGLDQLLTNGCSKILIFPMYPQYAAATSASTYDAVFTHLLKRRFVPTVRVCEPYYNKRPYVDALIGTINEGLKTIGSVDYLVLSYHGIPRKYVEKGDPYCCMCSETTRAIIKNINLPVDRIIHTYQSRFGKDPWLEPYTDQTIEHLAKGGAKRVAVACPGFPADCLETLDEIANEGRHLFIKHGGDELKLIPGLNDHPLWIEAMFSLVKAELGSWLQLPSDQTANDCQITCPAKISFGGSR